VQPSFLHSPKVVVVGEYPNVFRIGLLGHAAVTVWLGKLHRAAAVSFARVTSEALDMMHGERGSSVQMIDERVQLPDVDTRDVLVKIMRDSAPRTACVSIVIDGGGFWASAVRGFVTSLGVLAPRTFDIHAHASIAQVLDWLPVEHHKRTGVSLDPAQLAHLLAVGKQWQQEAASGSVSRPRPPSPPPKPGPDDAP